MWNVIINDYFLGNSQYNLICDKISLCLPSLHVDLYVVCTTLDTAINIASVWHTRYLDVYFEYKLIGRGLQYDSGVPLLMYVMIRSSKEMRKFKIFFEDDGSKGVEVFFYRTGRQDIGN